MPDNFFSSFSKQRLATRGWMRSSGASAIDYLAPVLNIPNLHFAGGPNIAYQEKDNSNVTPALIGDSVGVLTNRMTSGGAVMSSVEEGDRPALVSLGGELLVQGGGVGTTIHLATTLETTHAYVQSFDIVIALLIPNDTSGGILFTPHSQADGNAWRFKTTVDNWATPMSVDFLGKEMAPVVSTDNFLDKVGIFRMRVLHNPDTITYAEDGTEQVGLTTVTSWVNGGAALVTAATHVKVNSMRGLTLLNDRPAMASSTDNSIGGVVYVPVPGQGPGMTLAEANAASDWIVSELNVDPRSGPMT
jgi:hypothetical protein